MSMEIIGNPNVSARAKAVFSYMGFCASNGTVTMCELKEHFLESREILNKTVHELIEAGYIRKIIRKSNSQFAGVVYRLSAIRGDE